MGDLPDCALSADFVNNISQLSHFAWGAFVVMAVAMAFNTRILAWWTWLIFEILAAIKEGAYDPTFEACDVSSFDWEDFVVYTAGTTVGVLFVWWSKLEDTINPLEVIRRLKPWCDSYENRHHRLPTTET